MKMTAKVGEIQQVRPGGLTHNGFLHSLSANVRQASGNSYIHRVWPAL